MNIYDRKWIIRQLIPVCLLGATGESAQNSGWISNGFAQYNHIALRQTVQAVNGIHGKLCYNKG